MTTTRPSTTTSRPCPLWAPPAEPARSPGRPATRGQLLEAARLGATVAAADLRGEPQAATSAYATWRRLRRRADGPARRLLRVAFDTGYGRGMQGAHLPTG